MIGGGPAGLAAASLAARAGLSTVLFDENPGVGGQIYRGITSTPVTDRTILGEDYWAGEALAAEARASGASIVNGATVWSLDPQRIVGISIDGKARMIEARRVIIATGAQERPFPIPGWTLPGVMTAGGGADGAEGAGPAAGRPHGDGGHRAAAVAAGGADPARRREDRGHPRHHAARQLAARACFICRTSCCRRTSPRGSSSCARCGPGCRSSGSTVSKPWATTSCARSSSASATTSAGWRPISCCCTRAWCPTSISPSPPAWRMSGTPASSASSRCSTRISPVPLPGIAVAGDGAGIAGGTAAAERGRIAAIAAVRALKPEADGARSADRAAAPAARGDGPRLPRLAEPARRVASAGPRATPWCAAARR